MSTQYGPPTDLAEGAFLFQIDHDAPPMSPEQRSACEAWLRSIDFLVPGGRHEAQWKAIQKHWVEFLNVKATESKRLLKWRSSFCPLFDGLEALTERWPPQARLILNQCSDGIGAGPFESLAARWDLDKRRRLQTVWSSLVTFLLYSNARGTLSSQMGLQLEPERTGDPSMLDEIYDSVSTKFKHDKILLLLGPDPLNPLRQMRTRELFLSWILSKPGAPVGTNGLLWWAAVLVRSALSAQDGRGDEYRNEIPGSIVIPMDLDILGRVEALRYYAKVLVLDYAMESTPLDRSKLDLVERDLGGVNLSWINQEKECRPADSGDVRNIEGEEWVEMLDHISKVGKKALGQKPGTVMHNINRLYADLSARK